MTEVPPEQPRPFTVVQGEANPNPQREAPPDDRYTPVGVKFRLLKKFGGHMRFTDKRGWLAYVDGCWRPDPHAVGRWYEEVVADLWTEVGPDDRDSARFVRSMETARARTDVLKLAEPWAHVGLDAFDRDPFIINCPNGTLDLRSGELHPHAPTDMLSRMTGAPYVPWEKLPHGGGRAALDEYLETFVPEESWHGPLFRTLGMMLPAGNVERYCVILLGPTGTGKTMLTEAINTALGDYAVTTNSSVFRGHLGDRPRSDVLRLYGPRVAIIEEAGESWELHADRLKLMTGGGSVAERGMFSGTFVDDRPTITPLMTANAMPRIKGADNALRRRLPVIPFNYRPAVEDVYKRVAFTGGDAGYDSVATALLSYMVQGYLDYREHGLHDLPQEWYEATSSALGELNHVEAFVESLREDGELVENPELPANQCARTSEFHERYVDWVRKHGDEQDRRERLGRKQFTLYLRDTLGWELVRSDGSRWAGRRLRPLWERQTQPFGR